MNRIEHIARMTAGLLAYLLTVKLIPTWLPGWYRLFMALLPHAGYYALHPFNELPWHVPVEALREE
ncbi:MAG: hypothetical protein CMI02_09570 [Oceanospirillaceae bacterium]|nr:hypothetical protein [Oceanospirillaceae bacterium]|tara:strand:- start:152 stop:349 length:198 start_codon:yes stop_codon:yes gene_type:complete